MGKLVHNKKSNLGLLFEYVMRELVESLVYKDKNKRKKLSEIINKHFYKNKFIKEEFSIFTAILNAEYQNTDDARRYLIECLTLAENLKNNIDERKLAKQKLLEDIYSVVDKNSFFSHNIPHYKTYATINLVLDFYSRNKKLYEIKSLINLEKDLIEHIKNNKIVIENKKLNDRVINESNSISLDEQEQIISSLKYRTHFYNKLSKKQQEILEYYTITSDDVLIENFIDKNYKINHDSIKKMFLSERITFTKEKLKETLSLFETAYKKADSIEEKLKVVMDSLSIIENSELEEDSAAGDVAGFSAPMATKPVKKNISSELENEENFVE